MEVEIGFWSFSLWSFTWLPTFFQEPAVPIFTSILKTELIGFSIQNVGNHYKTTQQRHSRGDS